MSERTTMPELSTIAREGALDALSDLAHDYTLLAEVLDKHGADSALVEELSDAIEAIRDHLMGVTPTTSGRWLVWSNQKGMWWRPDERGYTSRIDEAGRYSREQADRIVAKATCDGELTYDREDPVTGRAYVAVDEVAVPAPPE